MSQRIDLDHGRFRQIIRGKIKENLRKYVSQGEMIARKGNDTVSVPIPQVDLPRFRFGDKQQGGVGQGKGKVGEASVTASRRMAMATARPATAPASTCSMSICQSPSSPRS